MLYSGETNEYLRMDTITMSNPHLLNEKVDSSLILLWCTQDHTTLTVDGRHHTFGKNQIICLTEFHKIEVHVISELRMIRFNRSFYCILDHDSEVSCKGILFFGASQLPVLTLSDAEAEKIENLYILFKDEMTTEDELQLEMLQMLLKILLISCTRLYKHQNNYDALDTSRVDTIREFNFLVEKHFRTSHSVASYAELLNKSPKTLSNLFAKLETKTPLQFIQDRIMLEARRLLRFTDAPVKEIAYEVGYDDIQSFSRFFKKNEGVSPSQYKKNVSQEELPTF